MGKDSAFDQENLRRRVRELDREKAEKEGLDDPNEFDRIKLDFMGKKYITDFAVAEAERAFHEKREEEMFKNLMFGSFESTVPRGKGLIEQINDDVPSAIKTYSTLTKELLEEAVKSLAVPSDPGKEFMVMTGAGGKRDLDRAMRMEHTKREAAGILVHEYMTILNEYDMTEIDKAHGLAEIRRKYHEVTGEHLDITSASSAITMDINALGETDPSSAMEYMKTLGIVMHNPRRTGYLARDRAAHIVSEEFRVTDSGTESKYLIAFDPINSTPEVPNLGDSPAGDDTGKGFGRWWRRKLGDSTKGMK